MWVIWGLFRLQGALMSNSGRSKGDRTAERNTKCGGPVRKTGVYWMKGRNHSCDT